MTPINKIIEDFILQLQAILTEMEHEVGVAPSIPPAEGTLSKQMLLELASHEGIVRQAYRDSVGVLTWGIGVTNNSGHKVDRYINNPQTLAHVLTIYEWLARTKYLPDVVKAFKGKTLTEAQTTAALSFHYNTGAIGKAAWVKSFIAGDTAKARKEFMNYSKPVSIIERRKKERDLFFDGTWSNDGTATEYTRVNPKTLVPIWKSAVKVDLSKEFK
jgi:lysozyme